MDTLFKDVLDKHNYVMVSKISNGKFGDIYKVLKDETVFAMKVLTKKQLTRVSISLESEIQLHSSLKHPNIVEVYEYFSDSEYIFIIMEYLQIDLYRHMKSLPDKRIDEITASKYLRSIIDATIYCHANNVVHRDLKTDNALLTDNGTVKICDFGWSIKSKEPLYLLCGTTDYLCPEIVSNKPYNYKCDIWCIGVLMYEMICGDAPFVARTYKQTYERIQKCDLKIPEHVTPDAKDLLQKILVINPNDRLSLQDILKHPWMSK